MRMYELLKLYQIVWILSVLSIYRIIRKSLMIKSRGLDFNVFSMIELDLLDANYLFKVNSNLKYK
jgi:hypothetical protein